MATPRGMRSKSIGHYILGKTIGEGTFGKVKLGTHILTGEKARNGVQNEEEGSSKCGGCRSDEEDVADVERVAREIHILKLVQHPHIIQLYEIIETPRQLYLIMEFCCGGELFDYIVAQNRVKESEADRERCGEVNGGVGDGSPDDPDDRFAGGVVGPEGETGDGTQHASASEAARFVHQIMDVPSDAHRKRSSTFDFDARDRRMNVVHRDLKPENLLLDEQKNIKIVDFGLSNTYQDGQLLKTACGSPCYAAPEMVAGQRYVPSRCDVWSCGVILFALVCPGTRVKEIGSEGQRVKEINWWSNWRSNGQKIPSQWRLTEPRSADSLLDGARKDTRPTLLPPPEREHVVAEPEPVQVLSVQQTKTAPLNDQTHEDTHATGQVRPRRNMRQE
ncbi:5'-AMP-activated protein kinase catalytic subunit alpha-2 (AMPK subunit alpha-2) (Acetyl-CoA carboxylase kinase) (ACACA kinase) (Hydroxymethylglutaryl-CoA reductase kinase) (HMGCR kinase) [Durusdinium trenchii]|uniref:5'-AMP-activated protein kinase catalytic subunit alpha-2 (AMPK subunit alpha-2) (Acetyl-CoA carboxylase kinase) (ACACA kinase) (Hydroxymethylglutaryl-CoA reductase kinase) (HMGCR kinase) n=1 Tax=Durusdinium trenchii TaxID=1381693 RepID=A0ABP0Q298_9DINO